MLRLVKEARDETLSETPFAPSANFSPARGPIRPHCQGRIAAGRTAAAMRRWLAVMCALSIVRRVQPALISPSTILGTASAGTAANVWDQSLHPTTHFHAADPSAPISVEANFTGNAWYIESYWVSTYELPPNLRASAPRSWTASCSEWANDGAGPYLRWVTLDSQSFASGLSATAVPSGHNFATPSGADHKCLAFRLVFGHSPVALTDVSVVGTFAAQVTREREGACLPIARRLSLTHSVICALLDN